MSGCSAPVFSTAAATTKRAATVIGAGLENPAKACSVEMTPEIRSTTSAPRIAIIGATRSRTRATTVNTTTSSVNQASSPFLNQPPPCHRNAFFAVCWLIVEPPRITDPPWALRRIASSIACRSKPSCAQNLLSSPAIAARTMSRSIRSIGTQTLEVADKLLEGLPARRPVVSGVLPAVRSGGSRAEVRGRHHRNVQRLPGGAAAQVAYSGYDRFDSSVWTYGVDELGSATQGR